MPIGLRGFQKGNKLCLGRKLSEEAKKKSSERMKGNKINLGRKRPPRSKEWTEKISKALRGKKYPPRSIEHRRKISENNKKNGNIPPSRKGKKHTEEAKQKLSKSLKGRIAWNKNKKCPQLSGEKCHLWKGGITPENQKIRGSLEYKLWSDSVWNRDNNCCQKCGENRISKLTAHHILNFSKYIELRFAIDNGITFCRECHKEFHNKYGRKNNKQEQLEEFLTIR